MKITTKVSICLCLIVFCTFYAFGQVITEGPLLFAATKSASKSDKSQAGWQADWQATIKAAQKEGKVVVYEQWGPKARTELGRAFKQKFGIDIEFVSAGTSTQLVPKLTQERSAGLYLADIIAAGTTTAITQMRPAGMLAPIDQMLILPDVKDPKTWRDGKLYLDKEKLVIGMSLDFASYLARNTEQVKEQEIKSYYDLLNPKWKGKILLHDPTINGPGNGWVFAMAGLLGMDKTKDYLRQLVKQEPALVSDYRLQVEWLAKGKYALVAGIHAPTISEFIKLGAPVAKLRVKEGGLATSGAGALSIPSGRMPHPNAAKLFINWILTKEGQTLFSNS